MRRIKKGYDLVTKPCRFTPFFVVSWLVAGERKILQVFDLAGFGLDVSPFGSQLGGERGIRTPGASQLNGFQDRRNRPLCHLSECKSITDFRFCQIFPPGNSKSPDQKNVLKQ